MAFFTFTTVSGSAATNNLVYDVEQAIGGKVFLSLSGSGTLVYTNAQGNSTDTGWTLSNLAANGQRVATIGANASNLYTTLATFQSPGLAAKLSGSFAAGTISAEGATSAQIDAFVANHAGAGPQSLANASVNVAQFAALKDALLLANGGAVAVDATGATQVQIATLANNSALVGDSAINNIDLLFGQYGVGPGKISPVKIADGGASIDASFVAAGVGAGLSSAMIADINATIAKVAAVDNVSLVAANLTDVAAFNTFASVVVDRGIDSLTATGVAMTSAVWAEVIANRAAFGVGSISGVDAAAALSVANFLTIPNKFAVNGIGANGLSLLGATSAQVDGVIANKAALGDLSLTNATITPVQFAALTAELAATSATVDAATATSAQVDAFVANLGKFVPDGLTNVTLNPTQLAVANAAAGLFATAVGNGEASVVATTASVINATAITTALNVTGSDGADYITMGDAANTVQGGKGADFISAVGAVTGQELRGGNAVDTIIGGDGNDTIAGGKSIAQQTLTGGNGVNTFDLIASSNNLITDLKGAAATADIINNAAGAVTVGNASAGYTLNAASSNNGALTLNANALAAGSIVNATLLTSATSTGITMNAGVLGSVLTGTNFADTVNGSVVADNITGGAGNDVLNSGGSTTVVNIDTLTGGSGADIFHVQANPLTGVGEANITDLASGDAVVVDFGGVLSGTTTAAFVATSATTNAGTATITAAGGGANIDMSLAAGSVGYNLVGGIGADTLTGSALADTISGGGAPGTNFITGGAGADQMTGGGGSDSFNYNSLATVAAQTGITLATADNIATFTTLIDKIVTGTAGVGHFAAGTAADYATAIAAANTAFETAGINYYFTTDVADGTNLLFVNATAGDGSADAVIKVGAAVLVATDII